MRITGYSITSIGARQQNQDSFLVDNERSLFAVADGIGGGERGDVASLMAVTGVGAHPDEGGRLRETVETIQQVVLKEAMDSLGDARMGTTLTAVRFKDSTLELCHVGDSRCYRYAAQHLQQLSTDHETFDEGYGAPVLSSYLGIPTDLFPFQVQDEDFPIAAGERYLLCSDGLYKQVSENDIMKMLETHAAEPQKLLEALVAAAVVAPFSDNVTIVYIEVD
ncbi:protein phosphatase 2C domain-containing protein [bacterium]|nr:protein phosphatase 2C domain-containing protein [bacterium]